jgi:hypothetical protein
MLPTNNVPKIGYATPITGLSDLGNNQLELVRDRVRYEHTKRTVKQAKGRRGKNNLLADGVTSESPNQLARVLSPPAEIARLDEHISSAFPENPKAFVLTTKKEMPQWADYRELNLGGGRLEVLKCKIETESPYFRFGFKLLNKNGRLFGDGSIKSQDTNLIVHIGRNNWNRPNLGISAKDIFLTKDLNGVALESDKKLFSAARRLSAPVELKIDSSYIVTFSVNGIHCMKRIIPPEICRRIVVLAWSDGEEYEVEVSDLSVTGIEEP